MISKNVFLPEEIPYAELQKIGISQTDVLRMPRQLIEPLLSGRVTPLLMGEVQHVDGYKVGIPMKLQLTRDAEGQTKVLAYPIRKDVLNDLSLSKVELDRIKEGQVIRKEISEYGKRTQRYYQLDAETNSVMQKDATALRLSDRIKDVEKIGNIELGLDQKKSIHEGKPVELSVGGDKVTVGVNLKEPTGFTHLQGDMEMWKQRQAEEYDRITPGFMGFVKTDENRWEYQQVLLSLQGQKGTQKEEIKEERQTSQSRHPKR